MRGIRRKEKEIVDKDLLIKILKNTQYMTLALSKENQPYLVSLSHGYDEINNCFYFHCASEGKKLEYINSNDQVWGQILLDKGYLQGECAHAYITVQFKGKVSILTDFTEKKHALEVMILQLDDNPEEIKEKQLSQKSIEKVSIGKIDIDFLTGKQSSEDLAIFE